MDVTEAYGKITEAINDAVKGLNATEKFMVFLLVAETLREYVDDGIRYTLEGLRDERLDACCGSVPHRRG